MHVFTGGLEVVRNATGHEPENFCAEVSSEVVRRWLHLMDLIKEHKLTRIIADAEFEYVDLDAAPVHYQGWDLFQYVAVWADHLRLQAIYRHDSHRVVESEQISRDELVAALEKSS